MKRVTAILIGVVLVFAAAAGSFSAPFHAADQQIIPSQLIAFAGPFLDPNDDFGGLRPTKAQRGKLIKIAMDIDQSLLPLKLEEGKKRIELSEMLLGPNPEQAAVSAKLDEIIRLEGQKQKLMADGYFRIMRILTQQQKQAFSHLVIRMIMGSSEGGIMGAPGGENRLMQRLGR